MAQSELKEAVLAYIDVIKEEKSRAKQLAELRANKKRLREDLSDLLRSTGNDGAVIEGVATVSRTSRRRLQPLKRTAVEEWAAGLLGGADRGAEEVSRLYDTRDVSTVEDLTVRQA